MTHPIARALRRLRAWRESRYWGPRRQIEHLRGLVDLDARWMAHDHTAAALTARYGDALAVNWFRRPFEDVCTLRDRLGLNPWRRARDPKAGSISAADIERMRKELQDAADAAVTASNQAVRYLRERDAARTDLQRETRRADYLRRQLDTIAEQNAELRRAPGTAPAVTMTAKQLAEALEFVAPDYPNSLDQIEDAVCIQRLPDGKYGDGSKRDAGLYCWIAECQDEGSILLGEAESDHA